jgi:hypothetical protein
MDEIERGDHWMVRGSGVFAYTEGSTPNKVHGVQRVRARTLAPYHEQIEPIFQSTGNNAHSSPFKNGDKNRKEVNNQLLEAEAKRPPRGELVFQSKLDPRCCGQFWDGQLHQ